MEREIDRWIGAAAAVMRASHRTGPNPSDRKNEIADTSGRNEFPP